MIEFEHVDELAHWLQAVGVDLSQWGQRDAKDVTDLWREWRNGDTSFKRDPVRRVNQVMSVIVRRGGYVLVEAGQTMRDGRTRSRMLPPSEKMKRDEAVESAVIRCLVEEVGVSADQITLLPRTLQQWTHQSISPSYPNLLTEYHVHQMEAKVISLPDHSFTVFNQAADDPVLSHQWAWILATEIGDLRSVFKTPPLASNSV